LWVIVRKIEELSGMPSSSRKAQVGEGKEH
jgi:hypothetical protein